MISRPSLPLLLAVLLAGCGSAAADAPDLSDWRAMLAARDGRAAEAALQRELEEGASPADLAPFLGEAKLLQGDIAGAERWLREGGFSHEVAAHGFHMLGRVRLRAGSLRAAGQAFDKALYVGNRSPELWVDIGRLRWLGGEQAEAGDAAKRALEAGPDNPAALLFAAQLARESRGNAAALAIIERGLARAPADPDLLAERAATLGELGRAGDMLATIRTLAQAAPGDPRVYYLQAVLAARAGQAELARGLLERSGEARRGVPSATLLLAVIDLENGNFASAAQGLDVLARRQPDNQRVQHLLARALALGGRHRELVSRFGYRPTSPYLAMLVGRAYEELGDREKAARFLDVAEAAGALRIAPLLEEPAGTHASARGSADKVVAQVRNLISVSDEGGACRIAERNLASNPGSSDAAALAGDAALAGGDADAALRYYDRAAAIRRTWPLVRRMAAALDRIGQPEAATALVASHLEIEPANADAAAVLARRLFDRGDEARAALLIDYSRSKGRNDPLFARLLEG
jgi:tetratricopeptide (TPR) repeat protein